MAYDEHLADRIRALLSERDDHSEKRMFGGLCFMVRGHMCCGLTPEALMLRVGKERHPELSALPHARPMDFTGRPMAGMLYVDDEGLQTQAELAGWIQHALDFVESLPPKIAAEKKTRL